MPTRAQIKGVLLEEAILSLLSAAGYRTINAVHGDPTLSTSSAGLQVRGRGGEHQIDAIADFAIGQPFSNPQRLLVEAKCYGAGSAVGLPLVRNAVGVLKDTSEYWAAPRGGPLHKPRYHYQYALFSTSDFTREAQRYAFAHDIHLLPLRNSAFFAPIVRAIEATVRRMEQTFQEGSGSFARPMLRLPLRLSEFRTVVRAALQPQLYPDPSEQVSLEIALHEIVEARRRLDGAIIAMISMDFPLFLVPSPEISFDDVPEGQDVRITWDGYGWYIVSAFDGRHLFSFDLPTELFELYADAGVLSSSRALDLKEDFLSDIQAIFVSQARVRLLHFRLDHGWLERVRERVNQTKQPREAQTRRPW